MAFQLNAVKSDADAQQDVTDFAKNNDYELFVARERTMIEMIEPFCQMMLRHNTSDFHVFTEVFIKNDYAILTQQYFGDEQPNFIIDVGANIGCATLYLRRFFPDAKYIAIEASKSNFEALERNISLNRCENIKAINKAFWVNNDMLELGSDFRDGREWAFSTRPLQEQLEKNQQNNSEKNTTIANDKALVQGITLAQILTDNQISEVDILKIDIEGGEKWILEDKATMQLIKEKVKILLMEVHEDVILMETAQNIMKENGFNFVVEGAIIFARNSISRI